MTEGNGRITEAEALEFHAQGKPGKIEIAPTKPLTTQRDLSLAYSPGVAAPVKAIHADPSTAFDYTSRGNMVAVMDIPREQTGSYGIVDIDESSLPHRGRD